MPRVGKKSIAGRLGRQSGNPIIPSPISSIIAAETDQGPEMRTPLLRQWRELTGRFPVSYFANFTRGGLVHDTDADVIQDLLMAAPKNSPLDLILESPGGYPLSAERIVKVCKTYSSNFRVVVPQRAKSAATMISMGAHGILMGPAAELGPIDPQYPYKDRYGDTQFASVFAILEGIKELLGKIQSAPADARIEGLLSMLPPFDQAAVVEMRRAQQLAEELAIQWCAEMPKHRGKKKAAIKTAIKIFLDPEQTFSHGRPIDAGRAKVAGLPVAVLSADTDEWRLLHALAMRSRRNVARYSKTIETCEVSFYS